MKEPSQRSDELWLSIISLLSCWIVLLTRSLRSLRLPVCSAVQQLQHRYPSPESCELCLSFVQDSTSFELSEEKS